MISETLQPTRSLVVGIRRSFFRTDEDAASFLSATALVSAAIARRDAAPGRLR